jgi:hypothetical protein
MPYDLSWPRQDLVSDWAVNVSRITGDDPVGSAVWHSPNDLDGSGYTVFMSFCQIIVPTHGDEQYDRCREDAVRYWPPASNHHVGSQPVFCQQK